MNWLWLVVAAVLAACLLAWLGPSDDEEDQWPM